MVNQIYHLSSDISQSTDELYIDLLKKSRSEIERHTEKMATKINKTALDIYKNKEEIFLDIFKVYIGNCKLLDQINDLEVKMLMEAS